MMEELYNNYLDLLDGISADMDKLADLCREQCTAVRGDDLIGLNDVMKREQVIGLSLRGQEQKRQKLSLQLGLEGTRLSALTGRVPKSLLPRAQESVERLRRSYDSYQNAAQVARHTLEINLHEIEKIIAAHGIDPAENAGYAAEESVQPPTNMKTDFRA